MKLKAAKLLIGTLSSGALGTGSYLVYDNFSRERISSEMQEKLNKAFDFDFDFGSSKGWEKIDFSSSWGF